MDLVRKQIHATARDTTNAWNTFTLPQLKYRPLKRKQIRVLTLLPGAESDPIQCILKPVFLEEEDLALSALTTVTALSYCWGPTKNPRILALEDHCLHKDSDANVCQFTIGARSRDTESLQITENSIGPKPIKCFTKVLPNLYNALLALRRRSNEAQDLWVDALCIDQGNNKEKLHQVPFMGDIYRFAKRVVIWLGEDQEDSNYAMDCIAHNRTTEFQKERFMVALLAICSRPFFTRTWIVQEVVLNKCLPSIVCGTGPTITWRALIQAWRWAFPTPTYPNDRPPTETQLAAVLRHNEKILQTMGPLTMLMGLRNGVQSSTAAPTNYRLEILLHSTKHFLAGDPRDKIYGVLGIANPRVGAGIEANYDMSVEDVFRHVTIYLLTVELSSSIYGFLPLGSRPNMPSWVPDFAAFLEAPSQRTLGTTARDWSDLSKHKPDSLRLSPGPCGRSLIAKGILLDKIKDVVQAPSRYKTTPLRAYPSVLFTLLVSFISFLRTRNSWERRDFRACVELFTFSEYMIEFTRAVIAMEAIVQNCAGRFRESRIRLGSPPSANGLWRVLMMGSYLMRRHFEDLENNDAIFDTWMATARQIAKLQNHGLLPVFVSFPESVLSLTQDFTAGFCAGRTFFAGKAGWYGIGEGDIRPGDYVVLLFPDANVPFILRSSGEEFRMIGVANLPTEMLAGLAVARDDLQSQDFVIV